MTSENRSGHAIPYPENASRPLDGVLKFIPILRSHDAPPFPADLDRHRNLLREQGYIGVYPDTGIGHGNITIKADDRSFIVTATQTQGLEQLDENGYCRIPEDVDVYSEEVPYDGTNKPSSESRTTIAIMNRRKGIGAVVHVHFREGQERAAEFGILQMNADYEYGTVGFARNAEKVVDQIDADDGIFATPSHPDGIFTYAPTLDEAYQMMVDYCDMVKSKISKGFIS